MRWLMLSLLVSVVALLVAAAGVAHHISAQHRRMRRSGATGAEETFEQAEDTDLEL